MQPFNLIVHNTSQLLYRMGWDARNELYCSALHMSRPYQVRRVGNTKVFFPLLCNKPATIANKNTLFCDTNLLDWTLLIKYILAWFLALREMYQVWFVIVRLHLKLRLNNSIFLVGVTSEGGKCLSAKVMFTTCRILNIPNGVDLGKSLVWAWKESNVASFNSCLHCIFVVEIHFQRCLKDGKRKAQMRGREAPNGRKGDACSLRGGK